MYATIFAYSYEQYRNLGVGIVILFWISVAFVAGSIIRYFYLRSIRTKYGIIEGKVEEILKTELNHMPRKMGSTIHYVDMFCCTLKITVPSKGLTSIDLTGELYYKLSSELRIANAMGNPHPHIKLFTKQLKWNSSIEEIYEYILTI